MITFILGGAKSGKSTYAEQQAIQSAKTVIYIATAESRDAEMALRIQRHQQSRPQHWQTVEEPIQLAKVIQQYSTNNTCLLIDCLTLWLSNSLFDYQGNTQLTQFEQQKQALLNALTQTKNDIILVSNEVGQGIVPMGEISRQFVDESGVLHQKIAQLSDKVLFITAGLAQVLK